MAGRIRDRGGEGGGATAADRTHLFSESQLAFSHPAGKAYVEGPSPLKRGGC